MKAKTDPRHIKRRRIVEALFATSFTQKQSLAVKVQNILEKKDIIDKLISENAPEWPLDKLNKTDLAILRLAVWELVVEKKEPIKVIIDEAVELAKEYGAENSPAFVNGVLGAIVKKQKLEDET
jgi:N utilization substance protein B